MGSEFFFFCSAFHALMQWTHWPPFLKWGQTMSGYLLDLDILLSLRDAGTDWDFCESAYSNSCFKLLFSMLSIYSSSELLEFSIFKELSKAVN